ncbi:MerR family transcriptional regulator [Swingsia samuiensis]|uniref:MerR family transcriptional regulator n=1 Tax=Swingsia samuiensis TaxID=1293412 RepID=A0A4Y6UFB5_9PROT|nr:MerR family transcriptional regulator [Swingsia samuiensis]QDH16229.1 MerR family transcriptional regulator [Swingsia samuiensis]
MTGSSDEFGENVVSAKPVQTKTSKAPDAYRTISEVADELHIPQHRLRAWETIYPGVKPFRGEGGRRYYNPEHIEKLKLISELLYTHGYKPHAVLRILKAQKAHHTEEQVKNSIEEEPLLVEQAAASTENELAMSAQSDERNEEERTSSDAEDEFEKELFTLMEKNQSLENENNLLRKELKEILVELQALRALLPA